MLPLEVFTWHFLEFFVKLHFCVFFLKLHFGCFMELLLGVLLGISSVCLGKAFINLSVAWPALSTKELTSNSDDT